MNFSNLEQLYRSVIMDHYKHPRNKGELDNGTITIDMNKQTCGDGMRRVLYVEDDIIDDVPFGGHGCSISMASASMMTEAVKGQSVDRALEMGNEFSKMMLGEDYTITDDMGDI